MIMIISIRSHFGLEPLAGLVASPPHAASSRPHDLPRAPRLRVCDDPCDVGVGPGLLARSSVLVVRCALPSPRALRLRYSSPHVAKKYISVEGRFAPMIKRMADGRILHARLNEATGFNHHYLRNALAAGSTQVPPLEAARTHAVRQQADSAKLGPTLPKRCPLADDYGGDSLLSSDALWPPLEATLAAPEHSIAPAPREPASAQVLKGDVENLAALVKVSGGFSIIAWLVMFGSRRLPSDCALAMLRRAFPRGIPPRTRQPCRSGRSSCANFGFSPVTPLSRVPVKRAETL